MFQKICASLKRLFGSLQARKRKPQAQQPKATWRYIAPPPEEESREVEERGEGAGSELPSEVGGSAGGAAAEIQFELTDDAPVGIPSIYGGYFNTPQGGKWETISLGEEGFGSAAKEWFDRGVQQAIAGDFEGALASFDKAIAFKHDYHEAWYNRGAALGKLGRFEEALASFDRAISFKHDFHEAWGSHGFALANLGRLEEAIASYDRATSFKHDKYEAWGKRGVALANLGRLEEAIASYDRAISFKHDFHEAWGNRGIDLKDLGRLEEAIWSFDRVLSIRLQDWVAWHGRGQAARNSQKVGWLSTKLPGEGLDLRGYEGAIASFTEGLKHVLREEQPEGWGVLQYEIGRMNYIQGRDFAWLGRPYRKFYAAARQSFNTSLETLTAEAFPERHLRVLKDYARLLFDRNETEQADELLRQGTDLLYRLLQDPKYLPYQKKQWALEFNWFQQLTVDRLIRQNHPTAALETAEAGKNACLQWLLSGYRELPDFFFDKALPLLPQGTAAVYWHLSPAALTTFLLLPDQEPQVVAMEDAPAASKGEIGASLQHLLRFEAWAREWNDDYAKYRGKGKEDGEEKEEKAGDPSHPWRTKARDRLTRLHNLLQIDEICDRLPPDTENLLLVPHRDLHLYPLEVLFDRGDRNLAISRLPSLQVGLALLEPSSEKEKGGALAEPSRREIASLLSIEAPQNDFLPLYDADLEAYTVSSQCDRATRIAAENATKDAVLAALREPHTALHFTGHAGYDRHNPVNSALALAGGDRLTLTEIYNSNLDSYRLVSLSACETGFADNLDITSEYVGLASAFVAAGVPAVLSTLWTVESKSSALLCDRFYQLLRKGTAPARALAESKQWLRSLTNGELCDLYGKILTDLERLSETGALSAGDRGVTGKLRDDIAELKNLSEGDHPFDAPYFYAAFTLSGDASVQN